MVVPLRLDRRRIIRPAAQEVHRTDNVVERIGAQNLCGSLLILKIADLDAGEHLVLLAQLLDEGKIFIERILELICLQPFALERAHKAVVENEIVIVELLELRECVRVLRESDLINAAQGLDFRRPLRSSPFIEKFLATYRNEVPFIKEDIVMYKEIHKTVAFLKRHQVNY